MRHSLNESNKKRLREFYDELATGYKKMIGFPMTRDLRLRELWPFLRFGINNVGDPYSPPRNRNHSKVFEQEVVAFLANLFRESPENIWGYVTNGGTEGNLYALYVARELHHGGVVYYSTASHYSIPKCLHLLGMQGVAVKAQPNGEIDYTALQDRLKEHHKLPAIIVANIGTTMTEAKDDISKIRQILHESGIKKHFIHCDGALAAPYTALLEPHHPFDFADGADSIATSGHKFFGSPIPCGVVLVRKIHQENLGAKVEYIGTADTTISGSRNGHTPVVLWNIISKYGREGLQQRALHGLKMAKYAHKCLQEIGWPTWRNPNALTVMLATPPQEVSSHWQFAVQGDWSHIICMPGVNQEQIDEFVEELARHAPPRIEIPRIN